MRRKKIWRILIYDAIFQLGTATAHGKFSNCSKTGGYFIPRPPPAGGECDHPLVYEQLRNLPHNKKTEY